MTIKRWIGNAPAIVDVWTITLSGTVTSQTYTVTINSKVLTFVAGISDTVDSVLGGLVSAWNSLAPLPPPEFQELTASGFPAAGPFTSIRLTQDVSGRPTSITVGTTGGATFSIANTTPATGPNDFANPLNWSDGVAPVNADTLVFDNGNIPCKYNLGTTLTGISLAIDPGYSGEIGLPLLNQDNPSTAYSEYRTTSLTLSGGTVVVNSGKIGRCNLDFGANPTTLRVLDTGQRIDPETPVVLITGGDASSELSINRGDVGLAFFQGQTATMPLIRTAYTAQPLSDVNLTIGSGAVLTTLTKNGGRLTSRAGATTINQELLGGTLTLSDAAAVTTLNVFGGTAVISTTGTIDTINLYSNAVLDVDQDPRPRTVTNAINVHSKDVSIRDNQKVINSGTLSLNTHGAVSVHVEHGANTTMLFT